MTQVLDPELQHCIMNGLTSEAYQTVAAIREAAGRYDLPSVIFRPRLSIDGNQWCALYGENLQDGVAGFGDSPADAMLDFDRNWYVKLPTQRAGCRATEVLRARLPRPQEDGVMSEKTTTQSTDADQTPDTYDKPAHGWTCFHCGETFTTVGGARNHFGAQPDAEPGCMLRVSLGPERGLLMALRKAEEECRRAWSAVHDESTDAHKALASAQTRHGDALRDAEELGYARGLRDAAQAQGVAVPADERDDAPAEFCWLVELFEPDGNSRGHYHTGATTTLSFESRTTRDPLKAKRYATKRDALLACVGLLHPQGVWRAVQHGFATAAPVQAQAVSEIGRVIERLQTDIDEVAYNRIIEDGKEDGSVEFRLELRQPAA